MFLAPKRWLRRASEFTKTPDAQRAQIHIEKVTFSDGTKVTLKHDSIFVLTGPNNAGKSSALREIRNFLTKGWEPAPVVSSIITSISGTEAEFPENDRNLRFEGQVRKLCKGGISGLCLV
jgi:ATPase subunit of ABC transporter with duplicated ATPase domains